MTENDLLTVTIEMNELQRVTAIAISGTPGGDGHAVVLDADGLAFLDIGQNSIPQERGIFVTSRDHNIQILPLPKYC